MKIKSYMRKLLIISIISLMFTQNLIPSMKMGIQSSVSAEDTSSEVVEMTTVSTNETVEPTTISSTTKKDGNDEPSEITSSELNDEKDKNSTSSSSDVSNTDTLDESTTSSIESSESSSTSESTTSTSASEELSSPTEDVLANGILGNELPNDVIDKVVDPSDWTVRTELYWIKNGEHHTHLEDVSTDVKKNIQLVYALEIETQKVDYAIGELEVRIPYYLDILPGNICTPTLSIPDEAGSELSTNQSAYYYTIDTKGTSERDDDELVIKNCKPIDAGTNTIIEASFTCSTNSFKDCYTMSYVAKTKTIVGGVETIIPDTDTITYKLDTGVRLGFVEKEADIIYTWPSKYYGPQPDNFDTTKYNYVNYEISTYVYGN